MSLPTTYSEPELVVLLKKGDETAFSYLYEHYGATLYGIVLQVISQQEVAEDVLQEIFVKIYRNIDQYDASKGRLYTWMLHIARNTAIDTVRSKGFKKSKKILELKGSVNTKGSKKSVVPHVDHLGLDKVLSALSEEQQKVIDLAYFKGYTQEEISKELQLPLGTVKTRVRNALIHLRKLLNIS